MRKVSVLALALLLQACSGLLYIEEMLGPDPCKNIACPTGYACDGGSCLPISTKPCSPMNTQGQCPTEQQACIDGTCYANNSLPQACAAGVNGICPLGQACAQGACTALDTNNQCDVSTNPNGLCQGGQVCIQGYCFAEPPGGLECSTSNVNGYCSGDAQCSSTGSCAAFGASTCNPNANFDGTCPSWQTCAEGHCIGPSPYGACSAANPNGVCPANQVCVAGTCTEFTTTNTCSGTVPTGLCAANAGCAQGFCVALNSTTVCSTTLVDGLCPGGDTCVRGACQSTPCGETGGWACPVGQYCADQACQTETCDPIHPSGTLCTDAFEACVNGLCTSPTCSALEPNGVCVPGLICNNGTCTLPPCSAQEPNGLCPYSHDTCVNGNCVRLPCSATVLDGTCSGTAYTCDPNFGCVNPVPQVCCDTNLNSSTACALGACSAAPCSSQELHGACNTGDYCANGNCAVAPCGPYPGFQYGTCADPNAACVQGLCRRTGCTQQPNATAYCAPDVCDPNTGNCMQPMCSSAQPDGYCNTLGQVCCDSALQSTD